MVIVIENKDALFPTRHVNAPPPYSAYSAPLISPASPSSPSPIRQLSSRPSFQSLPQHILLQVVYGTVPSPVDSRSRMAYVETLYWLTHSLRLVSRDIYVACMNYLRTKFTPDYVANIKSPYSSDPFPLEPPESTLPPQYRTQSIQSMQRETAVLDRFITLKCSEDMRSLESELHLEMDYFKDLFELAQPKARTEDLVRRYGLRAGVISIVAPPLAPNTPTSRLPTPLPFSCISVNISPRKAGIMVLRRTVAEVQKDRSETLESVAKRLVKEIARHLGRAGG